MVMINRATKEMTFKVVYYGPGLGGKTTNLEYIYSSAHPRPEGQAADRGHGDGPHLVL